MTESVPLLSGVRPQPFMQCVPASAIPTGVVKEPNVVQLPNQGRHSFSIRSDISGDIPLEASEKNHTVGNYQHRETTSRKKSLIGIMSTRHLQPHLKSDFKHSTLALPPPFLLQLLGSGTPLLGPTSPCAGHWCLSELLTINSPSWLHTLPRPVWVPGSIRMPCNAGWSLGAWGLLAQDWLPFCPTYLFLLRFKAFPPTS